jgi:hypothetical protein
MTTLTSPVPSCPDTTAKARVRSLAYWVPTLIVVTETAVGACGGTWDASLMSARRSRIWATRSTSPPSWV